MVVAASIKSDKIVYGVVWSTEIEVVVGFDALASVANVKDLVIVECSVLSTLFGIIAASAGLSGVGKLMSINSSSGAIW